MTDVAFSTFSYTDLAQEDADLARDVATAIRKRHRKFIAEIGSDLVRVKTKLRHGAFTAWLTAEVGIEPRTAERYMAAARFLEGKPDTVSHLPAAILYRLSSPNTDPEVVAEIVGAATAGSPLPSDDVRTRLFQAEQEAKEIALLARRAKKATPEQLKAKLRKQQAERLAERERDEKEREQDRISAYSTARPLAARIVSALGDDTLAVVRLLSGDWSSAREFIRALSDAAAEASR